jgi:hypothetical protein
MANKIATASLKSKICLKKITNTNYNLENHIDYDQMHEQDVLSKIELYYR